MTLTKADVVARLYAEGQFTKSEASDAVERSLGLIKDALSDEQEVLISGFGKWSVRSKSQRRGRNPQTGDPLTLPARKVVTFRPSRVLKAAIHGQNSAGYSSAKQEAMPGGMEENGAKADEGKSKVLRPGYF